MITTAETRKRWLAAMDATDAAWAAYDAISGGSSLDETAARLAALAHYGRCADAEERAAAVHACEGNASHHQLDDAADEFRRGAQGIRDGLTLLSAIVREFEELEEPRTNELETIRIMAEHVASMANDVWSALETFD